MAGLLLSMLMSCASEPCSERTGDADCDGVPDASDACVETEPGALTDRRGCSGAQAAGCSVELTFPEDGARSPESFGWTGDCEVYVLQVSDHEDFPAGTTRSAWRGAAREVSLPLPEERYWRVVGGNEGVSASFETPPRRLK